MGRGGVGHLFSEKKKLDHRYITLGKSGTSDSISGSRVHKIHDIQIHWMLGKKVRQRSKVYLLWTLSQVQRKYMESWGEDTGGEELHWECS